MASDEPEREFKPIIGDDREYHFASGTAASKPKSMVYLDFFQLDPQSNPSVARTVARIVMLPSVLDPLIEQLSALREAEPDGGS